MSQRVISEAEPLGKTMGFRVSPEGLGQLGRQPLFQRG